jgi:hypothetical protein
VGPVIAFTVLAIRTVWVFQMSALIQHRHRESDSRLSWCVPAVFSSVKGSGRRVERTECGFACHPPHVCLPEPY